MIEFTLAIKPFSVNAYRYRDARFKTAEARAWETTVNDALEEHRKPLMEMADDFKAKGGTFRLFLSALYPKFIYYNKSGAISAKTVDCSNYEKPIQDMLFNFMGVNDRFVTELISTKDVGASTGIWIKLELHHL